MSIEPSSALLRCHFAERGTRLLDLPVSAMNSSARDIDSTPYVSPNSLLFLESHMSAANFHHQLEPLTHRETDILSLIAQGKVTKEIAAVLSISPNTVSYHRKHICSKLCIHSTAELVVYATRRFYPSSIYGRDGRIAPFISSL